MPVDVREAVLFQEVEDSSWFLLVSEEGFINNSTVFELGQHELAVAHEQRTACIAFVLGWEFGFRVSFS